MLTALLLLIQVALLGAVMGVAAFAVSRALRIAADRRSAEEAMFALHLRRLGLQPALGGAFAGTWRGRPFQLVSRHRVDPGLGVPSQMSVGTPVPTGRLQLGASGRRVGEETFDRWFRVEGRMSDISLLTSEVRQAVLAVTARGRPRIQDGILWLDLIVPAGPVTRLEPILDPLVDLAEHLIRAARTSVSDRLVDWATDPAAGIRRTSIDLVEHHGNAPPPFVRILVDDPDPTVRVRAAMTLGVTGPLLAVALDPTVAVRIRLYAIGMLARRGSDEERLAAAAALSSGSDPVARASLRLCEATGPAAEPVVLGLLDVHRPRVVRAAVRWAAHHGSLATLAPLRAIEHRTSRLSPLAAEVRIAIERVRSRGSRWIGSVSLAADPPESGALSLEER